MTLEEKEQIKSEILNELTSELKGKVIKEDVATVLKETREYWFVSRTTNGKRVDGKMRTVIDSVTSWAIWEIIRKLTCYICGKSYVRHLAGCEDIANTICDNICKTVYEQRLLFLNQKEGIEIDET